MKTYLYLVLVAVIAFTLSLNTYKVFTIDETSLFLTIIGLIYGIISAFTISNAWEKFSGIRDAIAEETSALTSLAIYSRQLSDKNTVAGLQSKMIEYASEVPTVEWDDYWGSDQTHEKFREIIKIFSMVTIGPTKDELLFERMACEIQEAASARDQQLVLSQIKVPRLQWILNIFLSLILILGLVFVSVPEGMISIIIITTMITAVLLILLIIYELDSMKTAEAEVSIAPYTKLVRFLKEYDANL